MICQFCQTSFEKKHSTYNKYCSSACCGSALRARKKAEWYAGKTTPDRATLRVYLAEDRGYACEGCGLSDWCGKPITLEVDHINGLANNSSPANVRLLCPNCHSQTPHRGNGNKGRGRKSLGLSLR